MVLSHNLTAMNANRQLGIVTGKSAKSSEKLSSGYKINRAADDAAGLSISEKMRNLILSLDQGSENIQHGTSLVQIADGELAEVNDMLHRITELSVKAANGTNSDSDRKAIQEEINQIIKEIDRIHTTAKFNETYLFDGTDPMHGEGNKLGGLVESNSAIKGAMDEVYKKDGKYYSAAILDFSPINSSNIDQLYDKSFSFVCTEGCGETFTFKFANGGGDKKLDRHSAYGDYEHLYTVDIKGIKRGSELIDRVFDAVKKDPAKPEYKPYSTETDLQVSHAAVLRKDGEHKLVVYRDDLKSPGVYAQNTPDKVAHFPGHGNLGKVIGAEIMGAGRQRQVKSLKIQCSNAVNDVIWLQLERMDSAYIGVKNIDVTTEGGALDAINVVSQADLLVSEMRARYGAYQNRLEHSYNNNQNKLENTTAAESRIRDTDMAEEMVEYSKNNILKQAGQSMLAQANQSKQGVLSLLQ
ncbi:MAG: flagellin [Lachnospiraceae bacterium]|nr:flagellin [Lachnospiraceae bacterium]